MTFAFSKMLCPQPHGLSLRIAFPEGRLRVYHVPYIYQERVRSYLFTDDCKSATRKGQILVLVVCHFGLSLSAIFGLFPMTMFNSSLHYINHTSQPLLPHRLMLSVALRSHDLVAILPNKATLLRWLLMAQLLGHSHR
jgi:hypothetical protein